MIKIPSGKPIKMNWMKQVRKMFFSFRERVNRVKPRIEEMAQKIEGFLVPNLGIR